MKNTNLLILMDELGAIILIFLFIMFGPPVILTIIGFAIKSKKKKAAKILFILAAVYLLIGLGICFTLLNA